MHKKIISMILIAALLLPLVAQAGAASPTPTAHGIDVSHHQGVIDWDTAASHIDFAILRCGYGIDDPAQDDRQWKANVEACTRLKIPFGVYIYSYAITEEQARSEARHVLRLLEGYSPSMPVYLDLEDNKLLENCSTEQILKHATIFCDMIEAAGYRAGIYANTYWWTKYLSSPEYDKWDRWVARYASETGYNKPYSMWQYTSEGSVPGIEGNVDRNRWYAEPPTAGCRHSYTAKLIRAAGCETEGLLRYTCSLCGEYYDKGLPATGHSYRAEVVAPGCTVGGYTRYSCQCGASYTANPTAPLGHSWDEGTVTRPPTQSESGVKSYLCTLCGLTMTVTVPALGGCENCPSGSFTDVPEPGHWAHAGIDFVLQEGLFRGMSEDAFAPEEAMTRAMLVTVLWRHAGSPSREACDFTDVPVDEWYSQAVAWAEAEGIVKGMGDGSFAPQGKITREQLATILHRYCGNPTPDAAEDLSLFPDEAQVSDYARQALSWAVSQGLIRGMEEAGQSYLVPQGSATRAQVATILQRLLQGLWEQS